MTVPSWFPARLVVYALVGASGTLVHYLLFLGLLTLQSPVLFASLAGYMLGAFVNYWLNYRLTFVSQCPHWEAAPRFAAVATLGLALNLLVVALMNGPVDFSPLLSQFIATSLCLLATYALNAKWSFAMTGEHSKSRGSCR